MSTARAVCSTFQEHFNIDSVVSFLDRVPFSPPFLLLIPLFVQRHHIFIHGTYLAPQDPTSVLAWWALLRDDNVRTQYKIPLFMMTFIMIKTVHRALSRITHNNGYYRGDPPKWEKEVCVVTGGSGGIGKEIALLLAQRSKQVVVLDVLPMDYTHPHIKYYKCNVGMEKDVLDVADAIRAEVGNPTILVNNAGIAAGRTILETPTESLQKVFAVNLFAHFHMVKAFLPYMIKHNHGHVVTVASSASYFALPHLSSYSASKSGALTFHETLKHELRTRYNAPNVRTSICCPTKVRTTLGIGLADPPSAFFTPTLSPQTVAMQIVRAIDRGLSEHIMLPAYTNVLPMLRGLPPYIKRGFEIAGKTDWMVTDETEAAARKAGYQH